MTAGGRRKPWTVALGVLLFGALVVSGRALEPDDGLAHFGRDAWDSDAGLPQNSVQVILQTHDGYFWLGTQEGLVRFDGVRFTVFDTRNTPELKDDWVQALAETRDGTLWIGTLSGLARRRAGKFESVGEGTDLDRALVGSLVAARDGTLWVGSSAGLGRMRDGKLVLLSEKDGFPRERVRSLYEDEKGALWFGLPYGLARLAGGELTVRTIQDGFPGTPLAIDGDRAGGVWVGTARGLVHVEASGDRLYGVEDGLATTLARSILRDRGGAVWIGTGDGLYRFLDGKFTRYASVNGLSSDRILSLYEDKAGSLWVGTTDGGLNRLKSQRVVNYTRHEGLSDDKVWTVYEDRAGTVWAGTADGSLDRLRPGSTTFEHVARVGSTVLSIAEDRAGALWVGTQGAGLVRFQGGRAKRFTAMDGLPGNWVTSLCVDRRGVLWIGTVGNGVARYERGVFRSYHVKDGLPSEQIFSIFEDRAGVLWIGTFGGGLARMAGDQITTFTTRDGLAHDIVISGYEDSEGNHWFATRGGLSRWRGGRFTTFRQKEGLFHDAVQRVVEDGHGYLWLTSNRGIFRVRQAELSAAAAGDGRLHPVPFNTASGMRSAECNNAQHGVLRSRDGRLWFATVKGLAMADPARIDVNTTPPAVAVEEVLSGGETVEARGGIRLPAGSRHDLEFRYTAFNYSNPTSVRFRYRLEGLETRWVEAGARRTAYYTHLPPGDYRFHVVAANEDGVWNEKGAILPVRLDPYFYQTDWFRALAILAVAVLALGVHRMRVRQIESREFFRTALTEAKMNALQAQLRPHFLANTLNSILTLIGADSARARRMVERLGDLLRASLETDPGQVVTLDRELSILELYVSIEKMRFRERLEVSIDVDPAARDADVPSFLLQPIVENAIKHGIRGQGGRGVVRIRARAEGERLSLRVEDDGPGLARGKTPRPGGIGVRNTRQRLETLYPDAHRFDLANALGGGCLVTIEIPLTREAVKTGEPARVAAVGPLLRRVAGEPTDSV